MTDPNFGNQAVREWLERENLLDQYKNDAEFHAAVTDINIVLSAVAMVSSRDNLTVPSVVYAQCLAALDFLSPQSAHGRAGFLRKLQLRAPLWQGTADDLRRD